MIIETIVFVAIFILVCLICLVSLSGWIYEGEKLRRLNKENTDLKCDNERLLLENRVLKSKYDFLKYRTEEKKNGKV